MLTFVRHARSCGNILQSVDFSLHPLPKLDHPIITNLGVTQSILLGQHILNKQENYDACYCSPSIRTIMTALFALRNMSYTNNKLIIHINPYIIEENKLGKWYYKPLSLFVTDRQNHMVSPSNLKIMIGLVKQWLDSNWLLAYDDVMFEELLLSSNEEELKQKYKQLQENIMKAKEKYEPELVNSAKEAIKNFKAILRTTTNESLKKFGESRFLKGMYIDMTEYEKLYDSVKNEFTNGFASVDKFLAQLKERNHKNAIVFSHSNILKYAFKNMDWDEKLESVLDKEPSHLNKLFNTSAFKVELSTSKLTPYYPIVGSIERQKFNEAIKKYKERGEDIGDCKNKGLLNRAINKVDELPEFNSLVYTKYMKHKQKYIHLKSMIEI